MSKAVPTDQRTVPVSVVICARNEYENLAKNLPSILKQEHPDFEVVVVDDASWDGTNELLHEFKVNYPSLQIVSISEDQKRTPGKKMALTLGFKRASKDVFLLTDADCIPKDPKWIQTMTNGFKDGIRLGYGGYKKGKGLLNLLVRYETIMTGILYLSAAKAKMAYMGVGRNLVYSRSLYHDSGGFRNHYHLMSGDDDLFVNHNSTAKNTSVVLVEESHTLSSAPESFPKWIKQKRRHMSVSSAYSPRSKWGLGLYHAAQILFYLSLVGCIVLEIDWRIIASIYSLKTLIHLLISISASRQLKDNDMVVLLPILEPLMLFVNMIVGMINVLSRPKVWK